MPRPPQLVLASRSPRRAELLRQAGYTFEQMASPFDEARAQVDHLGPAQRVTVLAERKAIAVAEQRGAGVILGCDTMLSLEGRAIGKPADEDDARRVLEALMGRRHEVFSGACLVDAVGGRLRTFVESAGVRIEPVCDADLDGYIRSGRWRGKAGGYNLAELIGQWRFEVVGDPTTVIGLPMQRLADELQQFAPELHVTS